MVLELYTRTLPCNQHHQHHDTKTIGQLSPSLGSPGSGLPSNSCALGLLPVTLDTPMNRKFMPDADMSVMLTVMLNRKLMLDKGMSVMMMMIVSRKVLLDADIGVHSAAQNTVEGAKECLCLINAFHFLIMLFGGHFRFSDENVPY